MSYSGPRLFGHLSPTGQRGGVANQPYSALVSGLTVTPGTVTATACPLNIAVGEARLDGTLAKLTTAISNLGLITGTGFDQATPQEFTVYLRPLRLVPALTTAPSSPAVGDRYLKVISQGEYDLLEGAYEYTSLGWQKIDLAKEPAAYGHNNMPLNEVSPLIDSDSFALSPERDIYLPSGYPHFTENPGQAYCRRNAAIALVKVVIASSAATITPLTDYERSVS